MFKQMNKSLVIKYAFNNYNIVFAVGWFGRGFMIAIRMH